MPMNRMLRKWRLRQRMMRARADLAMQNLDLSIAKCPHCPTWFWGDTETEAGLSLSRHCVLRHDEAPDEEARDVREA